MDDNNTTVIIIVIVLIIIGLIILFVLLWNNGNTSSDPTTDDKLNYDDDDDDDQNDHPPQIINTDQNNNFEIIETKKNDNQPFFIPVIPNNAETIPLAPINLTEKEIQIHSPKEDSSNPGLQSDPSDRVLDKMAHDEELLASVEDFTTAPKLQTGEIKSTDEKSQPVHKVLNLEDGSFKLSVDESQKKPKPIQIVKPRPLIPQPNKITPYVVNTKILPKKQAITEETSGLTVDASLINPASGSSDFSTPTTIKINKNK